MKTIKKATAPRRNSDEFVREKLVEMEEYLKNVDLTIVYESIGVTPPQK